MEMEKETSKPTPQIRLKPSNRIITAGLPETGKTTLARNLANECLKALGKPNLYIIDPLNQYSAFDDLIQEGYRFVPQRHDIQDFDKICQHLCTVQNHTLLIEECEDYLWQGVSLPYHAYRIVRMGRNWGIGIQGVSQRIQEVDKKFVDRCQHLFLFKCGFESFDYLKQKLGRERAQRVLNLSSEQHEFVHYDIGRQTFHKYRLNLRLSEFGIIESTEDVKKDESPSETPQEANHPQQASKQTPQPEAETQEQPQQEPRKKIVIPFRQLP